MTILATGKLACRGNIVKRTVKYVNKVLYSNMCSLEVNTDCFKGQHTSCSGLHKYQWKRANDDFYELVLVPSGLD